MAGKRAEIPRARFQRFACTCAKQTGLLAPLQEKMNNYSGTALPLSGDVLPRSLGGKFW